MHAPQLATAATLSLVGLVCAFSNARSSVGAGVPASTAPRTPPPEALDVRLLEQRWMAAYAAGDERAFDALFKSLAPRLLGFFMRAIADRALADDLLQTTFVRLHAARHTYRDGAPVRPWVFTIAARVRIDELRRRRRTPRAASELDLERLQAEPTADAADDGLDQGALGQRVRAAIDALPESQRMVVHLHRFEELSFAQIGSVLGVSEGAARIRAFRAYAALRERLSPLLAQDSA
jgi:RNA polymerase sigma factor (sigma-70 family)